VNNFEDEKQFNLPRNGKRIKFPSFYLLKFVKKTKNIFSFSEFFYVCK